RLVHAVHDAGGLVYGSLRASRGLAGRWLRFGSIRGPDGLDGDALDHSHHAVGESPGGARPDGDRERPFTPDRRPPRRQLVPAFRSQYGQWPAHWGSRGGRRLAPGDLRTTDRLVRLAPGNASYRVGHSWRCPSLGSLG